MSTGAAKGKPDGGPAFPLADMGVHGFYGMSLRAYVATQVLAAIVGKHEPIRLSVEDAAEALAWSDTVASASRGAVAYADALIEELNRKESE